MSIPTLPSNTSPRAFAIIPAAGSSRRMGQDKLLLPWGEGVVIDAVIDAYQAAGIDAVVAVIHPDNAPLIAHCRARQIHVVVPSSPPAEMKDSVRLALEHIETSLRANDRDLWLIAPADAPTLSADVVRRVVQCAADHPGRIIVPTHGARRGHPSALPMAMAVDIQQLSHDEGVNALLHRHPLVEVDCGPAATPTDIDTLKDYRQMRGGQSE